MYILYRKSILTRKCIWVWLLIEQKDLQCSSIRQLVVCLLKMWHMIHLSLSSNYISILLKVHKLKILFKLQKTLVFLNKRLKLSGWWNPFMIASWPEIVIWLRLIPLSLLKMDKLWQLIQRSLLMTMQITDRKIWKIWKIKPKLILEKRMPKNLIWTTFILEETSDVLWMELVWQCQQWISSNYMVVNQPISWIWEVVQVGLKWWKQWKSYKLILKFNVFLSTFSVVLLNVTNLPNQF